MKNSKKLSFRVAFCGILSAMGIALLLITGWIPVLTYAAPLYVSFLLIPAITELGTGAGWCVWFVTALLTLIMSADKEAGAFYVFLGYYPMIRGLIAKIPGRLPRFVTKVVFFTLSIGCMYLLLIFVFRLESVVSEFKVSLWGNVAMSAVMVAIMMVADRLIGKLTQVYMRRLHPTIKKLLH